MRTIIVHYHIFKNAGTSLDHVLRRGFGDRWVAYERPRWIGSSELGAYLEAHPSVIALSSHNAALPPPSVPGARIVPILFVRHPVDRARSVYDYESTQVADTVGARMAKQLDVRGYIDWRLDCAATGDASISDFQTRRLASAGEGSTDHQRALDALARLPFVGLVEAYDASMERLGGLLRADFPGLRLRSVRLNTTTRAEASLDARLQQLRERIGDALYERLEAANASDLAVWSHVRAGYPGD